jgi:hypothetical protein
MSQITEEQLSETFVKLLRRGVTGQLPSASSTRRELVCQQGRPDFVGSPTDPNALDPESRILFSSVLTNPALARVLAMVPARAPRTELYLQSHLGMPQSAIRRNLEILEESGMLKRTGTNSYVRDMTSLGSQVQLWAFELKVKNWQRALYQGMLYRAFAHRVTVVFAERWGHLVEENVMSFRRMGIGLVSLGEDEDSWRVILQPKTAPPRSQFHYLYALGKWLDANGEAQLQGNRPLD